MKIYSLLGYILLLLVASCSSKEEDREIKVKNVKLVVVDFKKDASGVGLYTAYVSDTNWVRMYEFGDSLSKVNGCFPTIIGFYNVLDSTPKFSKFYSVPRRLEPYECGSYRNDIDSTGRAYVLDNNGVFKVY